jgi:sister chromatid cohesion protein DCC1
MLFRVREKWTVDEIAPYVESLTTPILNVNGLLTKFARAANVNGKKVFCSKHGK